MIIGTLNAGGGQGRTDLSVTFTSDNREHAGGEFADLFRVGRGVHGHRSPISTQGILELLA